MSGTSDQQKVREIAEDAIREGARTASIEDVLIGHPVVDHDDPESDYDAWFDAIAAQMPKAIVTVSWPDEQPQDAQPERPAAEVVWLTQDDEGNFGVWRDPDNARRQIIQGRAGEVPGHYEWVNDVDRTHELLLRDDEVTGLTLWMALVADAAPDAQSGRDGDVRAVAAALQAWAAGDNTKLGSALMALREVFIARIAELQVRTTRAELDAREAKGGE